jgi:rod shape-determining protein MreB
MAAIGGIDIMQPKGNMIVDIGGGTTEIAVIALGGIVCDKSVKIAGDVFTNDIVYYMRTQHNLFVGESTAEKIKIQIERQFRNLQKTCLFREEIYLPVNQNKWKSLTEKSLKLDKSIQRIEDAVMETLSQTPELAALFTIQVFILPVLDKRISQKQTYLFTLQKILYER